MSQPAEVPSALLADLHRNNQNAWTAAGRGTEPPEPEQLNTEEIGAKGFVDTGKAWKENISQVKTAAEMLENTRSKELAQSEMAKIRAQKTEAVQRVYAEELQRARKSKRLHQIQPGEQPGWVRATARKATQERFEGETLEGWLDGSETCTGTQNSKKEDAEAFQTPTDDELDKLDDYGLSRIHCLAILWSPRNPHPLKFKIALDAERILAAKTPVNESAIPRPVGTKKTCNRDAKLAQVNTMMAPELGRAGRYLDQTVGPNRVVGLTQTGWTGLTAPQLAEIFQIPGIFNAEPTSKKGRIFDPPENPDPIHSLTRYYLPMAILEAAKCPNIKDLHLEGLVALPKELSKYDPALGTFGAFAAKGLIYESVNLYYAGKNISSARGRDLARLAEARAIATSGYSNGELFKILGVILAERNPKQDPLTLRRFHRILSDDLIVNTAALDAQEDNADGKATTLVETIPDADNNNPDLSLELEEESLQMKKAHQRIWGLIKKIGGSKQVKHFEMYAANIQDKEIISALGITNPGRDRKRMIAKIRRELKRQKFMASKLRPSEFPNPVIKI